MWSDDVNSEDFTVLLKILVLSFALLSALFATVSQVSQSPLFIPLSSAQVQIVSVVGALAASAQAMRLTTIPRLNNAEDLLPEEYIIDRVNNDPTSTWVAGPDERWSNAAINDKLMALGTEVYDQAPMVRAYFSGYYNQFLFLFFKT